MCCGKPDSEVGPISWNGNCLGCAEALLAENMEGISAKSGYAFRRQLSGMERYVQKARAAMKGEEAVDA